MAAVNKGPSNKSKVSGVDIDNLSDITPRPKLKIKRNPSELPTIDRVMSDVPSPISTFLDSETLFVRGTKGEEKINISVLQNHLFGEGRLDKVS
jgi:hypothetical protein